MKRVISGVKPTGDITIGNYFGAMQGWPLLQQPDRQTLYFIADLHALNNRQEPAQLRKQSFDAAAWLLAMGIDYERSIVFVESHVHQIAELFAMLNNYVTMGELSRMTQFKDKSQKQGPEGQVVGLFEYPVLMAADILAFDVDEVPVGNDQKQHVEICREIVERCNNLYGDIFKQPEFLPHRSNVRIMDLQNPARKMSKSEPNSYILMIDQPDTIEAKIKRAVTDSGSEITATKDKPAITNLLNIFAAVTNTTVKELEQRYQGKSYGELKADLAEALIAVIEPLQQSFVEIRADEERLRAILADGQKRAQETIGDKLVEFKDRVGLI